MSKDASYTVRDLPRPERPRERFRKFGPEALSAQELLAYCYWAEYLENSLMNVA